VVQREVDVTPDIRLLRDIGAANYTVPQAINELVANSIDARYNDEPLRIDISIDEHQISVVDNGSGMTQEVLGESMRLSAEMDKVTGNKKPRKGMYGLGMKAACASLGQDWLIVTRVPGGDKQHSISVDLAAWVAKTDRSEWKVFINEGPRSSQPPLDSRSHGTAIVVKNLTSPGFSFTGAVMDSLASAYKPHLEAGDEIYVNGAKVIASAYDLVDGKTWPIDLDVGVYTIKGWVGLDKKTHNKGDYGLNIYRQNQLVDAHNKDFFRNHLMTSRIVGEIHLDFVNATFHKLGFHRNSEEWKMVEPVLREFLKPVVKASESMSKNKNDVLRKQKAIAELDRALGVVQGPNVPVLPEGAAQQTIVENNDASPSFNPGSTSGTLEEPTARGIYGSLQALGIGREDFSLSYTLAEMDDDQIPWDYIFDPESKELQAVINLGSRIYERADDTSLVTALALAEAVIGFLINERGISFDDAREIRDQWLFQALAK
jgi:hypothetical protein